MEKLYNYKVTGNGQFPLDMLRYDSCFPGDPDAVSKLCIDRKDPFFKEPRTVKVTGCAKPTVARWASFGWTVEALP
jgi:hypothetical protein